RMADGRPQAGRRGVRGSMTDAALDAWRAPERGAFRRTLSRGRLRVPDGPGRLAQVALWGFVHVLWAANDLIALGHGVPLDELIALIGLYRRGGRGVRGA